MCVRLRHKTRSHFWHWIHSIQEFLFYKQLCVRNSKGTVICSHTQCLTKDLLEHKIKKNQLFALVLGLNLSCFKTGEDRVGRDVPKYMPNTSIRITSIVPQNTFRCDQKALPGSGSHPQISLSTGLSIHKEVWEQFFMDTEVQPALYLLWLLVLQLIWLLFQEQTDLLSNSVC